MSFDLYLITDDALEAPEIVERTTRALSAAPPGRIAVQLRAKGLDRDARLALGHALRDVTARRGALLFVNEHIDEALTVRADGVHLPERARHRTGEARAAHLSVFVSCHDEHALSDGDFACLSPFAATPGKGSALGAARFAAILAAARPTARVFALGGIDAENAAAARGAGAHGVAVIRAIYRAPAPDRAAAAILHVLDMDQRLRSYVVRVEGGFWRTLMKGTAWVVGILAVIVGILHVFFVDRYVVAHNAMAPTMLYGDQVISWRGANPEMGAIAVCEHPVTPGQLVIGRVVARPPMQVKTERGQLSIAGTVPDRDVKGTFRFRDQHLNTIVDMSYGIEKFGNTSHWYFTRRDSNFRVRTTTVRHGIYLLGDNRTSIGYDSRSFGEVDPTKCHGTVFLRLWPSELQEPGVESIPHGMLDRLQ